MKILARQSTTNQWGGEVWSRDKIMKRAVANVYMIAASFFSSNSTVITDDVVKIPRKDKDFYAHEGVHHRRYYYVFDNRGQVFLEEMWPRNIATSIKDKKFCNFIHTTLQVNNSGINTDYPYVSYCGKEINFVCPYDSLSALVFKDINPLFGNVDFSPVPSTSLIGDFRIVDRTLIYGGDIVHPFDVNKLVYMPETGRLYHFILKHKNLVGRLGLLHPTLCEQLAERITHVGEDNYTLAWDHQVVKLNSFAGTTCTEFLSHIY